MGKNQQLVKMPPLGSPATLDALADYVLMQMLGHDPGGGGGEIPMIQYRYCGVEQIPFLLDPGKLGVRSMGLVAIIKKIMFFFHEETFGPSLPFS